MGSILATFPRVLEELAVRVAEGARVVVLGAGEGARLVADALRARGCNVTSAAHPDEASGAAPFDLALACEFPETWSHPRDVLGQLRSHLHERGRVLALRAGTGAAAVRIAVFGENAGEAVAPVLRAEDLDRFAGRALSELLASSGYRVTAGTFDDSWIEGVANESPAALPESATVPAASESAERESDERLKRAESEIRDLRDFVRSVLERQRRLHEELARLRAAVAQRDQTLSSLWVRFDDAFGSIALAKERRVELDVAERRLAEAEARSADLEARRLRLIEAVIELRER